MPPQGARRTPGHPGSLGARVMRAPAALFDLIEHAWETPRTERALGTALVLAFLGSLAAIELGRRGLLPPALAARVPANHFAAVGLAFTLLLVVETLALVFSLARSVADSVGKQFELLSLILLRKSFLAFADVPEPVRWENVSRIVPVILADMGAALVVFVATCYYYRIQRHRPITAGDTEQATFVVAKKTIALGLLVAFAALGAGVLVSPGRATSVHAFFATFYTALIFSDVLVVLVALRYGNSYHVLFRNSGFAAATLIARLALTSPEYVNAALGAGAALFGIAVSAAYNAYAPPAAVVPTALIGGPRHADESRAGA